MPAWGNHAAENLALIRGSQELMVDIAENPAWVRRAVREVSDVLIEVHAVLWRLVGEEVTGIEGSVNYCSMGSPGLDFGHSGRLQRRDFVYERNLRGNNGIELGDVCFSAGPQLIPKYHGSSPRRGIPGNGQSRAGKTMGFDCDLSCCISPPQFEEIFLPPRVETMRTVDHRIYHLDGTVALQHLDLLLSVPEIQAIQWVPGAGHDAILQWIPLIRRIQQAGKAVLVYAAAQDIPALLGEVSARGLCIGTGCASEQEARDLLKVVERLSRG